MAGLRDNFDWSRGGITEVVMERNEYHEGNRRDVRKVAISISFSLALILKI